MIAPFDPIKFNAGARPVSRNGCRVVILEVNGPDNRMFGRIQLNGVWIAADWDNKTGLYFAHNEDEAPKESEQDVMLEE